MAYLKTDLSFSDPVKVGDSVTFQKTTVAQQKQLTLCVTCLSGEPTLLVFVGAGDVVPLVGANGLGGDILTDSLRVGPDLLFRAVSFDLTRTRKHGTQTNNW